MTALRATEHARVVEFTAGLYPVPDDACRMPVGRGRFCFRPGDHPQDGCMAPPAGYHPITVTAVSS